MIKRLDPKIYTVYRDSTFTAIGGKGILDVNLYESNEGDLYLHCTHGYYNKYDGKELTSFYIDLSNKKIYQEKIYHNNSDISKLNIIDPVNEGIIVLERKDRIAHHGIYSSEVTSNIYNLLCFKNISNEDSKCVTEYKNDYNYYGNYGIIIAWGINEIKVTDITSIFDGVSSKINFNYGPDWCVIL